MVLSFDKVTRLKMLRRVIAQVGIANTCHLIAYFEQREQYERCAELLQILRVDYDVRLEDIANIANAKSASAFDYDNRRKQKTGALLISSIYESLSTF